MKTIFEQGAPGHGLSLLPACDVPVVTLAPARKKPLNNRMLDPSAIFIDGIHIKASANKKKFQKEQVANHDRIL